MGSAEASTAELSTHGPATLDRAIDARRPAGVAARLRELGRMLRPTPHVPLAVDGMNLFAKLEFVNPVGSIKDPPDLLGPEAGLTYRQLNAHANRLARALAARGVHGPDGLPFNTRFGNGDAIDADIVAAINAAYDAHAVRESWQAGDLLLVDNVRTAHGRESFTGPRAVLVGLADAARVAVWPAGP